MIEYGKLLVIIGAIVFFIGIYTILTGKLPPIGKLPGDIYIKKDTFAVYIPLTSMLALSILISILARLVKK